MGALEFGIYAALFFGLPIVVGGRIAASKGYTPWVGWILGLCLSVIGLLVVLLLPGDKKSGTRRCPYCAEVIREEAKVCRFCQRDLVEA